LSLWLRGIGPGRPELPHPAEELLVGTGQPLFGPPPPALAALISGEKFAGIWNYRWAVAGPDEAGLAGNHLAGLQVDRSFGGLTPAVLWYSDAARSRGRAEDRPTTALWVAAAGLELEDRSGTAAPLSPPVVSGKIKGKEHFDVLALPVSQVWPFDVQERWPQSIQGRSMDTYHRWMEVVIYATFAGLPSISVPAGFSAQGLPMGLQLIGKPQGDFALLQLAHAYEQAAQNLIQRRPPGV